jgi:hypothetical protein
VQAVKELGRVQERVLVREQVLERAQEQVLVREQVLERAQVQVLELRS